MERTSLQNKTKSNTTRVPRCKYSDDMGYILLSVFEELSDLYKPRTGEEANQFNSLRFDLPDSVGLLCDLRKIVMPNDKEFYDTVAISYLHFKRNGFC